MKNQPVTSHLDDVVKTNFWERNWFMNLLMQNYTFQEYLFINLIEYVRQFNWKSKQLVKWISGFLAKS